MQMGTGRALSQAGKQFIEDVLSLKPGVAAFDCDGTLWSGDAGETFFDWEIANRLVPSALGQSMRARYAEYKAGKVSEEEMCGEMVTMHAGMREAGLMKAATEFMTSVFPGRVFPEMRQLVRELQGQGCEIWAVSSSNEWVIRAGMKQFDIPENRILATKPVLENGIVTDRLIRIPSGSGKPLALRAVVGKPVDAAFGNSRWDADMLAFAAHPFAVNPNPDLEEAAKRLGWSVFLPDGTARG
jgi:phosphoserine phosphatase